VAFHGLYNLYESMAVAKHQKVVEVKALDWD